MAPEALSSSGLHRHRSIIFKIVGDIFIEFLQRIFKREMFGLVFPMLQAPKEFAPKIHAQNRRHSSLIKFHIFWTQNCFAPIFCLQGRPPSPRQNSVSNKVPDPLILWQRGNPSFFGGSSLFWAKEQGLEGQGVFMKYFGRVLVRARDRSWTPIQNDS